MHAVVHWTLVLSPKVRARTNLYSYLRYGSLDAWKLSTGNAEHSGTGPGGCTKELSPFLYRVSMPHWFIIRLRRAPSDVTPVPPLTSKHPLTSPLVGPKSNTR
jgi:hypothetical protein